MKRFIKGTSAVDVPHADGAGWRLMKTDGTEEHSFYELRVQTESQADNVAVMLCVIHALLSGLRVGVIAESNASCIASCLMKVWRDGRMLKRGENAAFVALCENFEEISIEDVQPCVDTKTTFRFVGFEDGAPEQSIFRNLMEDGSGATLELSCSDLSDGLLSIQLNTESMDEDEVFNRISQAINHCGCFAQVDF